MCDTRLAATVGRSLTFFVLLAIVASACTGSGDDGGDAGAEAQTSEAVGGEDAEGQTETGSDLSGEAKPDSNPGSDPGSDDEDPTDLPVFVVEPIDWVGCDAPFECATVTVPLDHGSLDAAGRTERTIELGLIRIEATGDARGSIFVNLGGPGGSTVSAMRNGFRMDEDTMASYHLVGFDPRGIGLSAPLTCTIDLVGQPRPDFSPDTDEERAELDAAAQGLAQRCGEQDGELLPHVGTDSVVGDLELLRRSVGDDRLNYIGLSYGTVIGLRYADRFPERVGRMVLDGVVDPAFSLTDLLRQQATEFERAFVTLDEACGIDLECPDGGIVAAYDRVAQTLENARSDDGVGIAEFQVATLVAMYSERLWPRFSVALQAAELGNFAEIERLHDLYVGGANFAAYAAVSCIDSRSPIGSANWDDFAAQLAAIAPRFGAALANELRTCAYWPAESTGQPRPTAAVGSEPILIVSTTGDAPTPLTNAVTVSSTLASAGLVTVDNEGHTAYGKSFCIDRIVADYFATGEVPAEVHRC